jgi:DNA repair exonuclease SbcCD ATPase subunit
MEDLFESAKRAASNAVERAAWEADKLRRVSERQKELELVRRERAAMVEQLVATVRDLEARGQITQPQLKSLAERLATLERDLANGQSDIQAIKNETYTPGSVSISVQRKGASQTSSSGGATYPCPTCGRPVRSSAAFCSACGARLH